MIEAFRKIWQFAGAERGNINRSIWAGFLSAVFHMFEIIAIYVIVAAMIDGKTGPAPALIAVGCMLVSIIGSGITNSAAKMRQTHAGYFMVANKRIDIANRLKSVPMGYFNENSLGEITGVSTTVLDNVETIAPMVMVTILGGMINSVVLMAMVLVFDWRIGLVVIAGTLLYLLVTSSMEQKSAAVAPLRQKSEAVLVGAILEQLHGMSVIKAFNLAGRGDKRVRDAVEFNRKSNLDMEELFTPYTIAQGAVLQLFSVLMTLLAVLFFLGGSMSLATALMVVVMSFLVFAQVQSAGSGLSMLRLVSSSIDHAQQLDRVPQMGEGGKDIRPATHDITFENVSFSYEKKEILHSVSLTIPDKTTTAIIGPSGSGKTTLTSLIARFWDVDSGRITIGGQDIRGYTLEALMDQISMVFQNVYLFADTIENNIKFGRPSASHEEVVAAAKRACCHDFISRLPDGYHTVVGEAGASLSGGERQRISIARAMLKDAPIVILDEATANVDPENEAELQTAIESLTHDKTIIMIAHRLKTVRHADQILVVDGGSIVQRGRHEDLIGQEGIYKAFVTARSQAAGWRLKS